MAFSIELFSMQVPVVWFLEREYGADIWVCNNTNDARGGNSDIGYVQKAMAYLDDLGLEEGARQIIVTDDPNAAFKTAFLMAGFAKNHFFQVEGEEGLFATKSEIEGVFLADLNMKQTQGSRSFPAFSRDLDGAVFRGAETEEELLKSLDMIVSCDLPYAAVIIDENLWKMQTVLKLVFDYGFEVYDARGEGVSEEESLQLLNLLIEENSESSEDGESTDAGEPSEDNGSTEDDESSEAFDTLQMDENYAAEINHQIRALRGRDFREEDLIRFCELLVSSDRWNALFDDSINELLNRWMES